VGFRVSGSYVGFSVSGSYVGFSVSGSYVGFRVLPCGAETLPLVLVAMTLSPSGPEAGMDFIFVYVRCK